MDRLIRFWLCTCVALFTLPTLGFSTSSFQALPAPGAGTPLEISRGSLEHIQIALRSPDIQIRTETQGFENGQVFSLSGEPLIPSEGCPSLPQVTRFYRIPNTGSVELNLEELGFDLLENIHPLPYHEGETATRNAEVYARSEWFPSQVATVSAPMQLRDFRVVRVTLYPVQVNPVTHQARVYHTLDVSVNATNQPGENEITRSRRPSGAWSPVYRSVIANLDESALDDATPTPGSYLIIAKTGTQIQPWVDSLATWKKRSGYDVRVESRVNWTTTTMTTFIRTAYSTWDPPLEYVTLMGDPQWSNGVPTGSTAYPPDLDHVFALGNTGDDLEDIAVGRLSGSTQGEMATINAKILGYERNPWMTDTTWYRRGFFYSNVNYGQAINDNMMRWAAAQFNRFTGVNHDTVAWSNGYVDNALVVNQFNQGLSFFLWEGSWVGQMQLSLPSQCSNGFRLPVTATLYEGTGDFATGFTHSEAFLVAGTALNPRGGICGIGSATMGSHWPVVASVMAGFAYNIANLGTEHLGTCLSAAKANLWRIWTADTSVSENTFHSRIINLMGEPSLSMWTDVPTVMNVTAPETLRVGTRGVHVAVRRAADNEPVSDALVVLWKGTETWSRTLTNADGEADVPVRIDSVGNLLLTVVKRNHKPYLATIPCTTRTSFVALSSFTIDDDESGGTHGNGNHVVNPLETIGLPVYLRNSGQSETATGITATLATDNPFVTVTNATATYPNIAPGDSALNETPFLISISPLMPDRAHAICILTVFASGIETRSVLDLECYAGKLEFVSAQIAQDFGPGSASDVVVTLQNGGRENLGGFNARLGSGAMFLQVDDPVGSYDTLDAGATGSNTANSFHVIAGEQIYRGTQVPMLLVATWETGRTDSVRFALQIGTAGATDPTGPDTYGYYAYDNSDTDCELHPVYDYVDITAAGTNLNLIDTGLKTTLTPISSTVRALPFPFTFYGQQYDTITICSNGWCAFGNQGWNDVFRNYPIPGMMAPDAMIAPYWDDLKTSGPGLGVWAYSDTVNHRYLIQWKAKGAVVDTALDFEVVLYDPAHYPGGPDGKILVQYRTVRMGLRGEYSEPAGCDVGIQGVGGAVGLSYAHLTAYSPGAATIQNGRAILFTTSSVVSTCTVEGYVMEMETGVPVANASVNVTGHAPGATTDAQGYYRIERVLPDTLTVTASCRRYNDAVVTNVIAMPESTVTVYFSMLHPEMTVPTQPLELTLGAQPRDTSFRVLNGGNGPLDCRVRLGYGNADTLAPWSVVGVTDLSGATGNPSLWGCEFAANHWWVTGRAADGAHLVYKFSPAGDLVDSISQISSTPTGWFDLAWDGHYLYGADGPDIIGMDTLGNYVTTIHTPLNPARALAYNPATDHFWAADYSSDLYEFNRNGNVLGQLTRTVGDPLLISGLAWYSQDPHGFTLYASGFDGSVERWNTISGDHEMVAMSAGGPTGTSVGCAITTELSGLYPAFATVIQAGASTLLKVRAIRFNTDWISVTPSVLNVPAGNFGTVQIHLSPVVLPPATYPFRIVLHSDILDTTSQVHLIVHVEQWSGNDPDPASLPGTFALYQNYPNPFNPATQIRFDLPKSEHVDLRVYNSLGQLVATLADEVRPAGTYSVTWNNRNASSGVYFYRLRAGSFVQTKKMLLMK